MSIDDFLKAIKKKQPPAPAAALTALETQLGSVLPDDYRRFLLAANGGYVGGRLWFMGPTPDGDAAEVGVHHVGGFRSKPHMSLTEVRGWYQGRIPDSLLWIMDDPFGNAICLGVTGEHRGHVFFWDHEAEPDPDEWDGEIESAGNLQLLALSFSDFVSLLRAADDD